jgi:hypothetical protein
LALVTRLNASDPVELFFMVTVFAGLLGTPTISLPNAKLTGENVMGATPVPVKVTICGEFDAVSLTVITPGMLPVVAGVNVTLIVHIAPALRVPPQVLPVCAKSPDAGEIESDVEAVPVFFTVTTLAVLGVPTACAVNVSAAGVTVTVTVVALPVPVRPTVCGFPNAVSLIVSCRRRTKRY